MQSASPIATTVRAPRKINWRLGRWWMAVNILGAALLAAREVEFYSAARASGFQAPSQTWTSLAAWFVVMIALGAAQAAACSWAFSHVRIAQRTFRRLVEAFLGLVSGFVFPLLGLAMLGMPDAALGALIFAPTGIVFGWLVATSQSEWFAQRQITETKNEKRAVIGARFWRLFRQWRMNWQMVLWWMAVNTAGVTVAVALTQWDVGFLPRGALLFLASLAILGALQTLICGGLISFIRIGNKIMRIAAGIALGFATAILVMFVGAYFISYYVVLGFWVFVPSGILFGWLLAAKQPARGVRVT